MAIKAGFVGLIGQPNAGKSTLVNALIGEKVSIVTHKPQTTRQRISGIYTDTNQQAIFLDAPGIVQSQSGLNKFLSEEYKSVIEDSDALIAVLNIDAKTQKHIESVIELCEASNKPWIAVLSKEDLKNQKRKAIIKSLLASKQVPVVEVSAKNNPQKAQDTVMPLIELMLPVSPAPLYQQDIYTTHNMRELCAEIIREKCFYYLHQEIPYGLHVNIPKFEEVNDRFARVYGELIVSKDGHKSMVVGKKGSMLKRIGQAARIDIETRFGLKVYLELHVIVKPQWMKKQKNLEEFGYVTN
jgi:GTP-binding protein Era